MAFDKFTLSSSCTGLLAVLMLSGCNDSGDKVTVAADPDAVNSLFDDTSGNVGATAWKVPEYALSYHSESTTSAWILDPAVTAGARPGGIDRGLLASGSLTGTAQGAISYERTAIQNGSGDVNFAVVNERISQFLGGLGDGSRMLAHDTSKAVFNQFSYSLNWALYLPASVAVGTTWHSDLSGPTTGSAQAFAYQTIGTVAYRPRIRTIDGTLPAGADPARTRVRVAVNGANAPTQDLTTAAIDYTTGTGYLGSWVNVQRSGRFAITGVNRTTPDSLFSGCVQVSLTIDYRPSGTVPAGATVLGLDDFTGSYVLYWKPGTGWVYWSGSETTPQWGFTGLTSPTASSQIFDLANYNALFDNGLLAIASPAIGGSQYQSMWQNGFQAGYRDLDPPAGYTPRQTQSAAFWAFSVANDITDGALQNDNGSRHGARATADQAFAAGYAVGAAYYSQDYTAAAGGDTLKSGANDRFYSTTLDFNSVPNGFRPDGQWSISDLGISNLFAGPTATGASYPNGFDGLGEAVDGYDPSVTTNTTHVKLAKDAQGRDLRGIYISLPVRGTITTKTVLGVTTQTGLANGGNG